MVERLGNAPGVCRAGSGMDTDERKIAREKQGKINKKRVEGLHRWAAPSIFHMFLSSLLNDKEKGVHQCVVVGSPNLSIGKQTFYSNLTSTSVLN